MSATMVTMWDWCEAKARRRAAEKRPTPEEQAERARRQQEIFALVASLALPVALVLRALSGLAR